MGKSEKSDDSKIDTKNVEKTQMVKVDEGKQEAEEGKQESSGKKSGKDKEETEKGKSTPDKGKEDTEKEKTDQKKSDKTDQKKSDKVAGDEPKSSTALQKVDDLKEGPRNVVFKVPAERKPVWSDVKLQNPTGDERTFKVKCTSATLFRVQPPFGFIKANDSTKIRVWFQNTDGIPTDGKKHYFAIYFMKSQEGKPAKEQWSKNSKAEGVCRINAVFEKKE